MSWGLWFWIIYVLALLFGGWGVRSLPAEQRWYGLWPAVLWLLVGILGWAVFGGPVK